MGVKGHCHVHKGSQYHSRVIWEYFPEFSIFRFFDPLSVCSSLKFRQKTTASSNYYFVILGTQTYHLVEAVFCLYCFEERLRDCACANF